VPAPQVGVGLPVYNGEQFVAAAIESVLRQTFPDFELIISDNHSTDKTETICRQYAERDERVKYYRAERNRGIAWNYNQVFHLSSKPTYFMWFSHDDILHPAYIQRCVGVLAEDRSVALCYSNWGEIDEAGRPFASHVSRVNMSSADPVLRFREAIRLEHLCEPWCGVTRTDIVQRTGMYGNFADYDRVIFAEIGLYGRFVELQETLFFRREHKGRSIYLYSSRAARASWINEGKPLIFVFPHCRELREFWAAVRRSKLSTFQKLKCAQALLKWAWTYKRRIWIDFAGVFWGIAGRIANILRMRNAV